MIRITSFTLVAVVLFLSGTVSAQVSWVKIDNEFGPLPPSIHLFRTNDSLDGKPNIAYYVKVPLKEAGIFFDADTALNRGLTPSTYFDRNSNPLLVINCTFFSPVRRNVNVVIDEGRMVSFNIPSVYSKDDSLYHYVTRSAIGIDRRGRADVAWIATDSLNKKAYEMRLAPVTGTGKERRPDLEKLKEFTRQDQRKPVDKNLKDLSVQHLRMSDESMLKDFPGRDWRRPVRRWKMETAVGGGPTLISNGGINITNNEERMFAGRAINDRHPRTAMGYTADGYLIVMAIEGRNPGIAEGATLIQEAEMLRDLRCTEALNLDGGGSSCMLINGMQTIKPSDITGQRKVPAVFIIKKAE